MDLVIGNYAACTRPGAGARTCSAICDPEVRGQDSLCFSAYRRSKPKQKAKPKHKPQAGTQGKSVSLIQDTP